MASVISRARLSEAACFRVVASLVAAERASSGAGHGWDAARWAPATAIGPEGLALDSLERLAASEVISRFFRLHEAGPPADLLAAATLGDWARAAAQAQAATTGVTFATSGTTGLPKLVRHARASLLREAAYWAGIYTGRRRAVSLVPAHHIYGFIFGVLLPDALDLPVRDARLTPLAVLAELLAPGDLLIAYPAALAALHRSGLALPPDVQIVTATSPMPATLHKALRDAGATITDIYGSTETGGIARRHDPDKPFKLLNRWRRGPDGATLIDTASGEAFPLPDRVTWRSATLLLPEARLDGAVQVAGVNVYPEAVARRLQTRPGVAACRVALDESLAEPRLCAAIVAADGADAPALLAALDTWCRARLPAPERPVRFDIVPAL